MKAINTKLIIYRKDKQPIKSEDVVIITESLDFHSILFQEFVDAPNQNMLNYRFASECFTVNDSTMHISLSGLIGGIKYKTVMYKLNEILTNLQCKLDPAYIYRIKAL